MKRLAVLLALVMTVGLVGCGNSDTQSKTETKSETKEETTTEEAFEGAYVVNADYVKENLDDIILVDARGDGICMEHADAWKSSIYCCAGGNK